jgi:squalene-hopene/tetraprenyl-beta-curcumene cyclase
MAADETHRRPTGHLKIRLTRLFAGLVVALLLTTGIPGLAADFTDTSYRNELQHAVERGLLWLEANQNSNGWWSVPDQPAVTAKVLIAFQGDPRQRYRSAEPEWLQRGYRHILDSIHPDGGIHRTNLVTYNTALSMMALLGANKTEYEPIILKARQFLVRLQGDLGEKGKLDSPFDGGIGYGSRYEHSDMGNTLQSLEAIYYSRQLVQDKNLAESGDLNWSAAIHFLQSCQNLPSHNRETWASDDPQNKGGFVYYPGQSMAGSVTNATTSRVALRSYGSISYGGMLSYAYAELKRDDPRVKAVFEWLRQNYTIEENPAMGPQGLYFYYHTMTRALTAYGINELQLKDGRTISWKRELSQKLLDLQQKDGSWINSNGRWWEKDPALVTAYAVLSLEMIHRGL